MQNIFIPSKLLVALPLTLRDKLVDGIPFAGPHRSCAEDNPRLRRRRADITVDVRQGYAFQEFLDDTILKDLPLLGVVAVIGVVERFSDVSKGTVEVHIFGAVVLLGGNKDGEAHSV